jgi:MFS family permease
VTSTPAETERPSWGRRLLWIGGGLVLVLVLGYIASATVPRWWAQQVGKQVEGSITTGIFVGMFYGFVFTLLPLALLAMVFAWRRTWKALAIALGIAIVLALPNLMTLGIVLGSGNAAHAGDRILDVEAPAFRGGSLVGAVVAILLVAYLVHLRASRRRAREREQETRAELEATHAPPEPREPDV